MLTAYVYGVASQITRLETGVYRFFFDITAEGDWGYRWEATGAVVAVVERRFTVPVSVFL